MALPHSWPGYQACTTAATLSSQGIVMGEPVLSTTIVRGLAAATCSTSACCFPGSSISGRSKPSLCHSPPKPTQTMATSEAPASRAARSMASAGTGGRTPTDSSQQSCLGPGKFEREEILVPSLQGNDRLDLRTSETKVFSTRGLLRPVLDHLAPVHGQAAESRAHQGESVGSYLGRREATAHTSRKLLRSGPFRKLPEPHEIRCRLRLPMDGSTAEIAAIEVLDGQSMLVSLRARQHQAGVE